MIGLLLAHLQGAGTDARLIEHLGPPRPIRVDPSPRDPQPVQAASAGMTNERAGVVTCESLATCVRFLRPVVSSMDEHRT